MGCFGSKKCDESKNENNTQYSQVAQKEGSLQQHDVVIDNGVNQDDVRHGIETQSYLQRMSNGNNYSSSERNRQLQERQNGFENKDRPENNVLQELSGRISHRQHDAIPNTIDFEIDSDETNRSVRTKSYMVPDSRGRIGSSDIGKKNELVVNELNSRIKSTIERTSSKNQ